MTTITTERLYSWNSAITGLGITWDREGFHHWLGELVECVYPLQEWLRLYGEFSRAADAADEHQTQADALR